MEERIVQLTTILVGLDTTKREQEAQEQLSASLAACGFECRLQEIESGRPNLIAQRGEGGTFLCSHIDVHPPHRHPDPWTCRREGSELVGRGVADTKGLIAALVTALEHERDAPACVVITCDEEGGGKGSQHLQVPVGPWFEEGGIVLEPTAWGICTAQTGHIDIAVEASATPRHAFAPATDGSPVTALLSVVEELDTCSFLKARHPMLSPPRLHVGRITVGEHLWRTPQHGRMELTLGLIPGTDREEATGEVASRLSDLAARWGRRGTTMVHELLDSSDATEVPRDLSIVGRLAKAMQQDTDVTGMPSWTDAGNLLVHHGLPCAVWGAGDLAVAHSDRESIPVNDLVRMCVALRELIAT